MCAYRSRFGIASWLPAKRARFQTDAGGPPEMKNRVGLLMPHKQATALQGEILVICHCFPVSFEKPVPVVFDYAHTTSLSARQ